MLHGKVMSLTLERKLIQRVSSNIYYTYTASKLKNPYYLFSVFVPVWQSNRFVSFLLLSQDSTVTYKK